MTHFESAIEFVKNHVSPTQVAAALEVLGNQNMELIDVDEELNDEIADLLEEYGADHGLPEGWWESEETIEEIVWRLI